MKNVRNLAILNAISFLIHLALSSATQFRLINNKDVGEISDQYNSLFTPSGATFIIWSIIYIGLTGFCVYHLVSAYKKEESHPANRDTNSIGYLFAINNIATAAWLMVWVNDLIAVSVLLIFIQLATLIMIHNRLGIHNSSASVASKIFTQFPLSVYLGWISIATIANISTWLTSVNWDGWNVSAVNWTITMIAIAVLLTVNVINRKKNVFFGLVVLWAFYGIMTKRMSIDPEAYEPIIMVIWGAMAIVGFACIFGLIRNIRKR